ncbi:TraR/DksA C4-type zinc finger protein [Anaerosalibacter sp. Marseille-P3206]|uniref:TraR/DksA C4-type zinc finger protein n=1 Tax=Anaerosalibacter sp. Marseille-P3206 TaxID=1871005 RepID=UPI00098443D1|nr:TraR/DksA C4-type zinc finger protein [Anaerosalibacter sp. Marseille-P3206]
MDRDKLLYFKDKLIEEKKKVENILKKMKENKFGSMEEYASELSSYDNHPGDLGTEMFMMEHDMGLKNKNNDTLYEIETSLRRIEEGNYGICEICGSEISEERLNLVPYIKTCMECANKKIPIEKKMSWRPEEEDVLMPFGKSHMGELMNAGVQYDKEDAYQEVAKYNRVERDPSSSTGDMQNVFDDTEDGVVEDVESISEEYYKDTL